MKKQFFRVKQLADQTFARAGKTEVLSDDLQDADRRVEFIKAACQNTSKKLIGCLLGQGQDAAVKEKKLKKCSDFIRGHAMTESGQLDEESLLGHILIQCGKAENTIASEWVEYEMSVEQVIISQLQKILDDEVPNIIKHKRNLAKLTLDMDSARTRYQTAMKHAANTPGGGSKVDSIRDELEDAEQKVEQCRDMLASEMFQLISKEADLAELIVQFAKFQKAYHESALSILGNIIPDLENLIRDSSVKPVYGVALEEHLRVTKRKVAYPIELCVCALLELAMEEEGLFRVTGGTSKVRRMKMSFDAGCMNFQTLLEYRDPHVIAGALKSYLRDLPEPLLTHSLYEEWMIAARIQTQNERLQALWQVLHKLPEPNFDNLEYLIKFLSTLSKNQDVNKMSPQNIAIVMAPNLMWPEKDESSTIGMNMSITGLHSIIVDSLVSYADWFFPRSKDMDFYITLTKPETTEYSVRPVLPNGLVASGATSTQQTDMTHHRRSSGEIINVSTGYEGDMKRAQSNSSLSDHSSPPQGSPRPVIRRKNKPAPVPPSPREPMPQVDKPEKPPMLPVDKPEKPPRPSTSVNVSRRVVTQATEKEIHQVQVQHVPLEKTSARSEIQPAREEENVPIGFDKLLADFDENAVAPSESSKDVSVPDDLGGSVGWLIPESVQELNNCVSERPIPSAKPPVAAPRTSLFNKDEVGKSHVSDKCESGRSVSHPSADEHELSKDCSSLGKQSSGNAESEKSKPVVPERPLALRQGSFRVSQQYEDGSGDKVGSENGRPMLERTHMYSVDKQQVSIIQVRNERSGESELQRTQSELQRTPSIGRPLSVSLPDKKDFPEKPERPPKPEHIIGERGHQSSHARTMSEGNIIDRSMMHAASGDRSDFDKSGHKPPVHPNLNPPSSPKVPLRPPRPQPPPPPSLVKSRANSASESTDL